MKQLILNQHQAKAVNNGATLIMQVVDTSMEINIHRNSPFDIYDLLPYQVGDEVYIAEEHTDVTGMGFDYGSSDKPMTFVYKADISPIGLEYAEDYNIKWQPASEMTAEQSRFKGEIVSVEVKRMRDTTYEEMADLFPLNHSLNATYRFKTLLKQQNIDYDSNPYVVLYGYKGE